MTLRALTLIILTLAAFAPSQASNEAPRVFNKLPASVEIGHHVYLVKLVDNLRDEKSHKKLDGACHYLRDMDDKPDKDNTYHFIEIEKNLSVAAKESTLIHEILHGIAHENGFPLAEKRVLTLESGLYEVFRRNGWKINSK